MVPPRGGGEGKLAEDLTCACGLQVEYDPTHGECLLLADQERDRVPSRNTAGAILYPLFAQVGYVLTQPLPSLSSLPIQPGPEPIADHLTSQSP